MPLEVFSADWAAAWQAVLNSHDGYREAAAGWEGAVVLVVTPDPADPEQLTRAVFLDLWHGACREGRLADVADLEAARYVLAATPATWAAVLTGRTPPLMAVMTGKLRLAKGALGELLPFANAAKVLMEVAAAMAATVPADWT